MKDNSMKDEAASLNTGTVVDLLSGAVCERGSIKVRGQGTSMLPFLFPSSRAAIHDCDLNDIARGDIIMYKTISDTLVIHRVYSIEYENENGKVKHFLTKGDARLRLDNPVRPDQVIGKVTLLCKSRLKRVIWNALNFLFVCTIVKVGEMILQSRRKRHAGLS